MVTRIASVVASFLEDRRYRHRRRWKKIGLGGRFGWLLLVAMGCASEAVDHGPGVAAVDVEHARELAFYYRGEALALSRLADHLELQMGQAGNRPEVPDPAALSRIEDIRRRADAAFERARQYRKQVPHNQVF